MKRFLTPILVLLLAQGLAAISLENSIDQAIKNNKSLLVAAEEIAKADFQYKDVKGTLLPQLSLQGGYTLSTTRLPDSSIPGTFDVSSGLDSTPTDNESYLAGTMSGIVASMIPDKTQKEGSLAAQLKLEQVLFLGGKLINGIKAVDRYRSIQKLQYDLTREELIVSTTDLFYGCLLAEKLVKLQEEALQIANSHLQRVQLFNREGQVSEFDLLRAQLEVAKLQPQLLQAQNQYELALAAFQKHIGSIDPQDIPEGEFVLPETLEMTLEEALESGSSQRIELRLLDINTEIMKIRYNAEKGNYLPNVVLQGDYSLFTAADEYAIESKDFGTQYTIGIGIQIPLFTGFSNSSKKAYAKHAWQQTKIQEQDYHELIALEIRQAHQRLKNSLENYEVQAQNIRLAERSMELARLRYENQVGIQLEVFDAQVMLNGVKLQYFQSIYEVISSDRNFKKSIGYKL